MSCLPTLPRTITWPCPRKQADSACTWKKSSMCSVRCCSTFLQGRGETIRQFSLRGCVLLQRILNGPVNPASKTPRHSLAAKTTCGANLVRPRRPWSRHLSDETEAHRILLVRQAAEMLFHLIDLDEAGKLQGTWLGRCFPIVYPILGTSSLSFPYSASYTEPG